MKQTHQNPHEGIRIALPFATAIKRALNTPAPGKAALDAFVKTGRRKADKPQKRRAK